MNVKKIAVFTPYSKVLNDEVIDYFKSENFEVSSNAYFDILSDLDIGKVAARGGASIPPGDGARCAWGRGCRPQGSAGASTLSARAPGPASIGP